MYITANNEIINASNPVTVGSIKYPPSYPKDEIPGLIKVTETDKPTGVIVTGFTVVDGVQVWQTSPYPLSELKTQKRQAVINQYEQKLKDGFDFEGNNYQMDAGSMATANNFMTGLLSGYSSPHGGYYRSSSNVNVVMNDTKLGEFLTAIGAKYGAWRANLHVKKDAISAATTEAELSAIDLTTGWE